MELLSLGDEGEEMGTQKLSDLPVIIQLVSG